MTLQVRLVHALGDRLIDLPEKNFESPLVIGRATDADIQVPATTVSRRHSLLYVHEGQWYVQDGNGGARTLVNGQPTPEPTPVNSGDVIVLGTDATPPTLTIDPYGLMQAAAPAHAAAVEPEPVAVQAAPAAPRQARSGSRYPTPAAGGGSLKPALPQPGAARTQQPPQIAPAYAAVPQVDEAAEVPAGEDDWLSAAPVTSESQRYYVPKQGGWSAGMITFVVFCGIGIIGGASYIYYTRDKAAKLEADRLNEANKKVVVEQKKQVTNVFEEEQALKRKAQELSAARANLPKVGSVPNAAAQDPGRQTEEWRSVKDAHDSRPPMEAIVIFGDYTKQFPGSPYAADVRKYTEDALDALWWEHVIQLAQEREDAKKEIVGKNRDLAQSQDPEFKKTLQEEKAVWEEKLQAAQDKLKEMNYLSDEKPNLYDAALMTDLRRSRNPVVYDEWKKMAEKKIKESRGTKSVW